MQTYLTKQIKEITGKASILELSRILFKQNINLNELTDLTLHPDTSISFKAAWLLENTLMQKPEQFLHNIPYVISRSKDVLNPSCKRHYAKILMHLTSAKAPCAVKQLVDNIDLEPVVETCFNWITDPAIPVAVKAYGCEALFNMGSRYPWVIDELSGQLEYLMRDGTAAIQAKGKRLLKAL